jgi:putative ABC transport system substrate-binding protein
MTRRAACVVLLFVLGGFCTPGSAEAPRKIGYLSLEPIREVPTRERKAFVEALAGYGWEEGKTLEIVFRSAENETEFLRPICEDLLREKVDVLATIGERATLACLEATRTVPVVFLAFGDPLRAGASDTLARPARNATGVSLIQAELAAKRIEFLRLAMPSATRLALVWDPRNRVAGISAHKAEQAARSAGMQSLPMPVESQPSLNRRLEEIADARPDALYVVLSPGVIAQNRSAIVELALAHRVAVISAWSFMTDAGGLLSYAPDLRAVFRRAAYHVDRVLRGTRPSDLPIEQPSKIELVVNVDTARRLGLTLPAELMLRADRVVQ